MITKVFFAGVTVGAAGAAAADVERFEGLDAFDSVSYALPYEVELVRSAQPFVELDGDADLIEQIEVEVKRGTLYLGRERPGWFDWHDDEDLVVTIGYERLEAITMAGSGNGYARDIQANEFRVKIAGSATLEIEGLETDELTVSVAGSGEAELTDVNAESVRSSIAGSGSVRLTGSAVNQSVAIGGSGDHDARELQSSIASARVSGSGDVVLWTTDELDAVVVGSGDIDYYGTARVTRTIRGSGDLRHRGDAP